MNMRQDEIYRARKAFFNEHAEKWIDMWYKDETSGDHDKHGKDFERLFSLLPLKAGDRVLDVGCGTGILVPYVLDRIGTAGMLFELDYAEKMIETNRKLHREPNISFLVAEAESAQLEDASCDVIICFSCFPHFHDKKKAMANLSRILKSEGIIAVSHFESSEGIKKHHGSCHAVMHDHLPDKSDMYALFQKEGLKIDLFIDEPGFYFTRAKK